MMKLREEAEIIINGAIRQVLPDEAVEKALRGKEFGGGDIYLVSVGKAAWQMGKQATEILGDRVKAGIVVTKYGHVKGEINRVICYEAGHPIPDDNSFLGTQAVLDMISDLREEDTVLFLLSGGGSALFEKPLVPKAELEDITGQLLSCGADIVEINTIRKRLSKVKGGRFAKLCRPAKIYSIVLSDILGNPLDMIASGPACPDSSTCEEALEIAGRYDLKMSKKAWELLHEETPKVLDGVETQITGSVKELCEAAEKICKDLGYDTMILTDCLDCEAREAGAFLAAVAKSHQNSRKSLAFIAGGETVVHLTGKGKGGRNQELALAAAEGIAGLTETAIFSVGSDGTDGPTDAAGGYCDENTKKRLEEKGESIARSLRENDAYHALEKCEGLIVIGPTGTNVNDVAILLIRR